MTEWNTVTITVEWSVLTHIWWLSSYTVWYVCYKANGAQFQNTVYINPVVKRKWLSIPILEMQSTLRSNQGLIQTLDGHQMNAIIY